MLSLSANDVSPNLLEFTASAVAAGVRVVSWDGVDGSGTTLNPTGLGGIDLTDGGNTRYLTFLSGADHSDGELAVRVYSDSGNWSLGSLMLPDTGGAATDSIVIPFTSFVAQAGGGADFTNVGAIEMEITGGQAVDGQLEVLRAFAPLTKTVNFVTSQPLSIGNLVWNDTNNNGQFDAGESPIGNVAVDLFEDTDGSGDFTPGSDTLLDSTTTDASGLYLFDALFPSKYVVRINPSNFVAGAVLRGFLSSTGNAPTPDPDNDVNNDDNGDALAGQGVVSRAITLTAMAEPTVIVSRTDLSIVKTDDVDPVTAGNLLTYTLLVTNHGPSDATGVTISDPLPSGTSFVSLTTTQGTASVSNGTLSGDVGNLVNGAAATITVTVRVAASRTADLDNTATVMGNQPDPNPGNNSSRQPTVVISRTDLAIVKSDDVDPITAGELLTYTLVVTNHGPSDATGVSISDPLPAGTSFVSLTTTQGTANVSNGTLAGSLGNLANGASETITVTVRVNSSTTTNLDNTATVTGNEPDPVPSNNSDSEPTVVITRTDLDIVKTDDSDPVVAGELLTYTLAVTNRGPSDATGVTVSDPLPVNTTFVSATATQGAFSSSNGVFSANVGNLANGAAATLTVTVRVAASTTTDLDNTATVTGNQPDPNPGNNSSRQPTVVIRRTDLAIAKSDNVDPVTAGELLTYTLVVTNNGPSDATGVAVSDPLPVGTTFVSLTTTQGTANVSNGTLTGSLGNLANGASTTITVTVRVNSSTTTNLDNTATVTGNEPDPVTGNEPDPVPSNNSDSEPTVVITRTDLDIVKTDDVDPVIAGNLLTYTIVVTNRGPSDATGVMVSDPLPAGVTFVSLTTTQGAANVNNGTLTGNLGSLANGASATINVIVRVNASTTTNLDNTATVTGNQPDPNPGNNSSRQPTIVITRADLEILKSDDVDPVVAGELLTYTLRITNHGPSDATGVTVNDPLPSGTSFVSLTTTQGTASVSNGSLSGNVGNLANGASATITVTVRVAASTTTALNNTATVTGNQTDQNPGNNSDSEPTQVIPRIDLSIDKRDDVDPVTAGRLLTYTLDVTNRGPSNATGVTVSDPLPAGVTFVSATTTQGTVFATNGVLTGNLGGLAPSATASLAVVVSVNSNTIGTINNIATATGNETDTNLTNNSDSEPTLVVAEVDLAITKGVSSPGPIAFGQSFTYTLLVMNIGPSDATGVTVVDDLPSGLILESATTTRGTVSNSNGTITANLGNLPRSATANVTLIVRANNITIGSITNTATVSGRETETTLANNTSSATTFLEPQRARIGGSVYVDANNNGRIDNGELPIAGVTVTLTGTDLFGNSVSLTRQTAANGTYSFDDLLPGTYRVIESQPINYRDGQETNLSTLAATISNDQFGNLTLLAGANATGLNFGELSATLTKRSFLASSPTTANAAQPRTAPLQVQAPVSTKRKR